ncbi:SOS response-associated peptidase [Paenibacillus aurantius]|uniref:Abasic site processing protein n=1 Tax=Paenibacillus aurantius TaxID=2918900 RepID=A0AA96RH83_9BACL|nr:SOS response-associated peptidase [Paenibacillus aurantius]WNQ10844.1 SOS response-associated peptidase [Paenibacillus aurantius]
MINRLSLSLPPQEVAAHYSVDRIVTGYEADASYRPTEPIPVLYMKGAEQKETCLDLHTWGIFPHWAKDSVNAESESIPEKPAYRRLMAKFRCLIPCDGFYTWRMEGKTRIPVKFTLPGRQVFGLAGIYDVWKQPSGAEYRTCTILTTRANRVIFPYHDRMPVILQEQDTAPWLDPAYRRSDEFLSLLLPYEAEAMMAEERPGDEAPGRPAKGRETSKRSRWGWAPIKE